MRKIVRRIYVDIIVVVLVFVAGFLTGTERAQRLYKDEQTQAITELRQRENQIRNDYDEIIYYQSRFWAITQKCIFNNINIL